MIVRGTGIQTPTGPFFGQELTAPVKLDLVAIAELMIDAVPAQFISKPGGVRLPTRAGQHTLQARGKKRQV